MPDQPSSGGGGGGIGATLKAKLGPLPTWGWLAIITVLALLYYLYAQHKAGQQQPTPSSVGQPGVVVINQGDTTTGSTPPTPPEDHDKDKDKDKGKGDGDDGSHHDDDDHHRHRKRRDRDHRHRHHGDTAMAPASGSTPSAGGAMLTGHAPGPPLPNVGLQFPTVTPFTVGETGPSGEGVGR